MFQGNPVVRVAPSSLARLVGKLGLASLVVLSALVGAEAQARGVVDEQAQVALSTLPKEAQHTQRLIRAGGPFPYAKDGTVFGNRERLLPRRERGHYREYTVRTPGSKNRGARRIVCGGRQPTDPEACFYTDDHYASFKRIVQ
ncbi:ribonuclease domain-containing protein [Ideonella sp. A 288]|uniref:ribonuclease domain-containing protein n=1 Tax=Ideonella sp. A 288 TaxID=1962181 RepID=UPI000B4BC248|nr:ribonuclease domain-containing protein [Ideonella sp. A 288]